MRNARHVKVRDLEKGVRGMRPYRRKLVLTDHFIERWQETIGQASAGKIKARLWYELQNNIITGAGNAFTLDINGYSVICFIGSDNAWVFCTVLRRGMEVKEVCV